MTGLKSGSGDDLWGDDGADDDDADDANSDAEVGDDRAADPATERSDRSDRGSTPQGESAVDTGSDTDTKSADEPETEPSTDAGDSGPTLDPSTAGSQPSDSQSYIVRRAVQDKSVQFERDERLTFFVHDDVADGERDLITELESALGRDVPKFDVREAVYRAALRNPDDVLDELLKMGYSVDEE